MKLNKILSIAAMSLALAFAACDDEAKYTPGEQSPGAYFPETNPATVTVQNNQSSFSIEVCRTTLDSPTSYQIVSTDAEGIFTIPTTVTFSPDKLVTELVIDYPEGSLELKHNYAISLALANAGEGTIYGPSTYKFDVVVAPKIDSHYIGFGTYNYEWYLKGYQPSIPIYKGHMEGEIETDSITIVGGLPKGQTDMSKFVPFFGGYSDYEDLTLQIVMHYGEPTSSGMIPCEVQPQGLGIETSYGEVMISDIYNFYKTIPDIDIKQYEFLKDYTYYDPRTGRYEMYVIYYGSTMEPGYQFRDSDVTETLQLDGFPDYTLDGSFGGLFTESDFTQTYALINVESGADINEVRVSLGQGENAQAVYKMYKEGKLPYQTAPGGEETEFKFPVANGGKYYAILCGYVDDEEVNAIGVMFNVGQGTAVPNDPNAWLSHGLGDLADGFILPLIFKAFPSNFSGFTKDTFVEANIYQVEVQTLKENPMIIRLVNPYGPDSTFPYASNNNTNPNQKFNITINATDPDCVLVEPQPTGFAMNKVASDTIANLEGAMYYQDGSSYDEIKTYFKQKKIALSTFTDNDGIGKVTITTPWPSFEVYRTYKVPNAVVEFVLDPISEKAKAMRAKAALKAIRRAPELPAALKPVENATSSMVYFSVTREELKNHTGDRIRR